MTGPLTKITRRRVRSKPFYQLQNLAGGAASVVLGLLLLIWSVTPIYNMWMIALDSHDEIFSGTIWPENPSLESYSHVTTTLKKLWPTPQCAEYLLSLLADNRQGTRVGFPLPVVEEIVLLLAVLRPES